ncbi:DUF1365 family protein [Mycolicibacterium sp.]|uniref:DUF1365 family protein n=1 Tax=Mycolicibacterium sp. TaxID=2320850 RepID=UPI0025EF62C4|nr:DUF1365 family protein [Mycolicibacterium sp.]
MTATIARAAIYPTRVTHLHRSPVHHYGEHGSYSWYVDIDDLPRLPWWVRPFARFEAADHLDGAAHDTLRQRVDAFLARNGVHLTGGRVTALLMPRVLGHTFAPLSLFWCHDAAGALRAVVAEVQDVDGGRKAYLLPPGDRDPVAMSGYLLRAPKPGQALDLTLSLHGNTAAGQQAAMVATWRGTRRDATPARVLWQQLRTPLAPQRAAWSMRMQSLLLRRPVRRAGWRPSPAWSANGRSFAPS